MMCLAPEQIAAAASGENRAALGHARMCLACGQALEDQLQLRAAIATLPSVPLPRDRRAELAAELLARADGVVSPRRSRPALLSAIAVAAAATVVLVVRERTPTVVIPPPPRVELSESFTLSLEQRVAEQAPDAVRTEGSRAAWVAGRDAEFGRSIVRGRDVVELREGEITIDSRRARSVEVSSPSNGRVGVRAGAKVAVVARAGVIQTVAVFAGSAEVTSNGRRYVIEAGATWQPEAKDARSLEAFRDGWMALRAGRHADAIAAFDRAVDPVVAEDAVFWAGVAAERAGDTADARRRHEQFLTRFPESPRAAAARAAITRLME